MKIRGPGLWRGLHQRAIGYPWHADCARRRAERRWLAASLAGLPCDICARHATAFLAEHPPLLEGTTDYQAWVFQFHNAVNSRLGKRLLSFAEYQQLYRAELIAREVHGD